MIFGDVVERPTTAEAIEATAWIAGACRGTSWTVGALVPNQYPSYLRVRAPEPGEHWWSAYRDLFDGVATVGERHTASADRVWFAVWEGHGFGNSSRRIATRGPLDDATREAVEQERARLRDEDERHNAAVLAALREVPRFELPHRIYHLMVGPVTAATQLHDPDVPYAWRRPDLVWPDDRRWFVATDVDFWSLYIGGDPDFITEIVASVPTSSEFVPLDRPLEIED